MCFVSVEIVEQGRGQFDVKTPLNKAPSKPANYNNYNVGVIQTIVNHSFFLHNL